MSHKIWRDFFSKVESFNSFFIALVDVFKLKLMSMTQEKNNKISLNPNYFEILCSLKKKSNFSFISLQFIKISNQKLLENFEISIDN